MSGAGDGLGLRSGCTLAAPLDPVSGPERAPHPALISRFLGMRVDLRRGRRVVEPEGGELRASHGIGFTRNPGNSVHAGSR